MTVNYISGNMEILNRKRERAQAYRQSLDTGIKRGVGLPGHLKDTYHATGPSGDRFAPDGYVSTGRTV
ncbi:hypothetical protein EKTHUN627_47540 [Enterobacter kobei]|nr:hypothetical protein EKTHUN627_47540 [Enterobacter kobei]